MNLLSKLKNKVLLLAATTCAMSVVTQPVLKGYEQTETPVLQESIRSLVIPSPIERVTKESVYGATYSFVRTLQKVADSYPVQEKQPELFEMLSQKIKALYALDKHTCTAFVKGLIGELAICNAQVHMIADTLEKQAREFNWAAYYMGIAGMATPIICGEWHLDSTQKDTVIASVNVGMLPVIVGVASTAFVAFASYVYMCDVGVDKQKLQCAKRMRDLKWELAAMNNYLESCLEKLNAGN